jgi:pyruvate dehydrogenase phosphatase
MLVKTTASQRLAGGRTASLVFSKSIHSQIRPKYLKMRGEFRVALVAGALLGASYYAVSNNGIRLDSGANNLGITSVGSTNAANSASSQHFFSTTTTNSLTGGESTYQQNKQGIPVFTDEEVNRRLRKLEESYIVNRGKGVYRYDTSQLPSNNPIEDDRAEKILQIPIQDVYSNNEKVDTDWHFWTVFDGHAGWNTSAYLRDHLIDSVITELNSVYKISEKNLRLIPSNEVIDKAIKQGFVKLDDQIVNKNVQKLLDSPNKNAAAELLMPALSGSCALMSFYDTHSKMLKVAVTGDSRALLGSFNEEMNKWTVEALSVDQTGSNPTEVAKLLSEHPNEPNVVRNGRILGSLEPSRAFGDARYKWAKEIQAKVYNQFFGRQSPANLKTPPYVTAEPILTTHEVNPSKNDFMVMASDGLYEMLSNEEIVGLVVKWMESKKMIKPNRSIFSSVWQSSKDKQLPGVLDISDKSGKPKGRYRRADNMSGYLLEDENVSTHLIRNALSNGGQKDNVNLLMSIPNPLSRRYRDDLTVTVVFFDDNEKLVQGASGLLEINRPATRGGLDETVQPKL